MFSFFLCPHNLVSSRYIFNLSLCFLNGILDKTNTELIALEITDFFHFDKLPFTQWIYSLRDTWLQYIEPLSILEWLLKCFVDH